MNKGRIRRAIKADTAKARALLADAREGGEWVRMVALAEVKRLREINRDRRTALRTGALVVRFQK